MWVLEQAPSDDVEARVPMRESLSQLFRGLVEVVEDQLFAESSSSGLLLVVLLLMISRTLSP